MPPISRSWEAHGKLRVRFGLARPAHLLRCTPPPPNRNRWMKIDIVVRPDHLHRDAVWKGNDLIFHGRVVASVVLDAKWPRLWRVRLPDGHTTDMVNLSRARDAARSLALKSVGAGAGRSLAHSSKRGGRYTALSCARARHPLPRIERTSGQLWARASETGPRHTPMLEMKTSDGTVVLPSAKKF
jgi:hypothetical protein